MSRRFKQSTESSSLQNVVHDFTSSKKKNYWNRFKRIPVYTKKTWMALGISQRASAAFYSPLKIKINSEEG